MNPIQMLQSFMGKGGNPQQLLQKAMNMNKNNNPMIANLVKLAQSGNKEEVEQFARNCCKERGINYDEEFPKFMSNFKNN